MYELVVLKWKLYWSWVLFYNQWPSPGDFYLRF